ncbi:MAG: helix-turn-helix domain-containing protein [Kineosporiaceae bacterium]
MPVRPLHAAHVPDRAGSARPAGGPVEEPRDLAVGAEIRALRKAGGLTLATVADRAGISVGYLSEIERDLTRVPIAVLHRLCEVLGISIGWLLRASRTGPEDERDVVVRAADRTRLAFPGLGISAAPTPPGTGPGSCGSSPRRTTDPDDRPDVSHVAAVATGDGGRGRRPA